MSTTHDAALVSTFTSESPAPCHTIIPSCTGPTIVDLTTDVHGRGAYSKNSIAAVTLPSPRKVVGILSHFKSLVCTENKPLKVGLVPFLVSNGEIIN